MPYDFRKKLVDFACLLYHLWRWNNRGFGSIFGKDTPWKIPETPRTPSQTLIERWRETVLRYYLETSDVDRLKSLFNHGVGIQTEIAGQAPLAWAIEKSDPRLALFLLANGADPHSLSRHGEPVLFAAIRKAAAAPAVRSADLPDFLVVVEALLEKGANIHQVDPSGHSPLYAACREDHLPLLKLLIRYGADVNQGGGADSSLGLAVMENHLEIARYLLAHGAAITKYADDEPLLTMAVELENPQMVELLLEYGADPQEPDPYGGTPFFWNAAYGRHEEIADALLRAGVDINARDGDGAGAFHIGIYNFDTEDDVHWFDFLLKRGADIDMRNAFGQTPFEYAQCLKNEAAIEYFLSRTPGADTSGAQQSIVQCSTMPAKVCRPVIGDMPQKQDLRIRITNILRKILHTRS